MDKRLQRLQGVLGRFSSASATATCPAITGFRVSLRRRWFIAFVISRIDYCNVLLARTPKATTDNLQHLLNVAARLVSDTYEKVRTRSEAAYACRPLLARRDGTSEVQAHVDGA